MIDAPQKSHQSSQKDSFQLSPILMIGFYFSSLAILLLLALMSFDVAIEVQQVVVVVIGLLLFASFSAFKRIINPQQKTSFFDQVSPYFDNRTITYNQHYNGDNFYNQKQNLADAAAEIQELLDKLSKTYDESPIDKSKIDVKLLAKIEDIESQRHEKLTDKEKTIAVQAVEEIQDNKSLKERLLKAKQAAEKELLNQYPSYIRIVLAATQGWAENDATESDKKTVNN